MALLSEPGGGGPVMELGAKSSGALFPASESNSSFMCLARFVRIRNLLILNITLE